MPVAFGFAGPTHQTRDSVFDAERSINWYPSLDQSNGHGKSKMAMLGTPGLALEATPAAGNVRGQWAGDERFFCVIGANLYELDSSLVTIDTIALPSDVATTPVQIAGNGNTLALTSGDRLYLINGGAATYQIDAVSVVYLDGFYIALQPNSNTFQISIDGATWDALDVAAKIGSLDRLVRLEEHNGQLWLIGQKTIEVWYNSGAADFPFERISGAVIDQGTSAPWSVCGVGQNLFWLGGDERGVGPVYMTQGYQPIRISDSGIEYYIEYLRASIGPDNNITGYAYQEDGHTFYVLNFPTAGATLVYDVTMKMWHERLRWTGSAWAQWRGGSFHSFVFGKHLVSCIGYATGKIYRQGLDIYADEGSDIKRHRATHYLSDNHNPTFHHSLKLNVKGTPAVKMRFLDDPEGSWSAQRTVTAVKQEATFRRLGSSKSRMYEIQIDSSTLPIAIIDGYLHATQSNRP